MTHYQQIHRALMDELFERAAGWTPETIQEALAAGRQHDRLMRLPTPDFRFERSHMGAKARVQKVLDRMRTPEAVFDPEAQQ